MNYSVFVDLEKEYLSDLNKFLKSSLGEGYKPKHKKLATSWATEIINASVQSEGEVPRLEINVLGDEIEAAFQHSGTTHKIKILLPFFGREHGLHRCTCLDDSKLFDEQKCEHLYLAELLLDTYFQKNKVSEPESSIDRLKKFVGKESTSDSQVSKNNSPIKFTFAINEEGLVQPFAQAEGTKRSSKKTSWKNILEKTDHWDPTSDALAMAFIEKSKKYPIEDHYQFLKSFIGTRKKIFRLHEKELLPCELTTRIPQFCLRQEDGSDSLVLEPFLDQKPIKNFEKSFFYDDGSIIAFEQKEDFLSLSIAKTESKNAAFMEAVIESPLSFNEEQIIGNLDLLLEFQKEIPIGLTKQLPLRKLEPKIVIRLHPFDSGACKCEILVQAFDFYFRPGDGLPMTLGRDEDYTPSKIERDFYDEREICQKIIGFLSLRQFFEPEPYLFILPNIELALSIIDAMNRFPDKDKVFLEWPKTHGQKPQIEEPEEENLQIKVESKNGWFSIDGKIAIDDEIIKLKDLIEAIQSGKKYVQLAGNKWAHLSSKIRNNLEKIAQSSYLDNSDLMLKTNAFYMNSETDSVFSLIDTCKEFKKRFDRFQSKMIDTTPVPSTIRADLRSYQLEGFHWLSRLYQWGLGGCLADDMGLGKTLQSICLLKQYQASGPSLVIAPTSLLFNWHQEIQKFCPELKSYIFWGSKRCSETMKNFDVVLTSYGTALVEQEELLNIKWNIIFWDEAQNIKNPQTKNYALAKQLRSNSKIALTGTPIENNLSELWSILSVTAPHVVGSASSFKKEFSDPIESDSPSKNLRIKLLRKNIEPFVLRRHKKDCLKELPTKQIVDIKVPFNKEELKFYEAARQIAIEQLEKDKAIEDAKSDSDLKTVKTPNLEGASSEKGQENQKNQKENFSILSSLTQLRQISCSPALIDANWPKPSSKEQEIIKRVIEIEESGNQVLVFSQFTSFLKRIFRALSFEGIKPLYLDGQNSVPERQEMVEKFQSGKNQTFLISLKAGGSGLNLTAASYVIIADPWWNPAVEKQAHDRAYRMGQDKPVTIYRMITKSSIEEAIDRLHRKKQALSDRLVEGQIGASKVSMEDLKSLLIGTPVN